MQINVHCEMRRIEEVSFSRESLSQRVEGRSVERFQASVCTRDKMNPTAEASGIRQRTHGAKFCYSSQPFTEMTEMQMSAEPGLASPAGLVCNCGCRR